MGGLRGKAGFSNHVARIIGRRGGGEKSREFSRSVRTRLATSDPAATYINNRAQSQDNTMACVFITGSSDGLGLMAGQLLADQGHRVVLHARNEARAADTKKAAPKAKAVVAGDLASIAATKDLAAQVNALGHFDAVIHNAAVGFGEGHRVTGDGVPHVFAINTLAPFILTVLIERPKRLVYLSSGMHTRAHANLDDILWQKRKWDGSSAYAESKLHDVMLAFTVARYWPNVLSNAVTPGWVPTKMGGAGAPGDIAEAHLTQAWLATSDDSEALTSGGYFHHLKRQEPNPEAREVSVQDRLIDICQEISGVDLPWS
jgi:NAD(P)-dependent dehydrogenase (short-subunit alcohol dehydrogenase family)